MTAIQRPLTLALALCALAGCRTPDPDPSPGMPLLAGLDLLGSVETGTGQADEVSVVVLSDRHATHGAVTRTRGPLRDIQRAQRRAIGFLLEKGFTLLGCEAARGALPGGPLAEGHRARVREALAEGDDLDAWTVYQPIRYEVELDGRLLVVGVEDPELYGADVELLGEFNRIRQLLSRGDVPEDDKRGLRTRRTQILAAVQGRVADRGRRAATNLVDLMREGGHPRAILMLGSAHVGAALAGLRDAGVSWAVFEADALTAVTGR